MNSFLKKQKTDHVPVQPLPDEAERSRVELLTKQERGKRPFRSEIINFLLSKTKRQQYVEIGVRRPWKNFDLINCKEKYSVDPGVEFMENPVKYKMTSDSFFESLFAGKLDLPADTKFDVIFIDGLHLAEQVERDIENSLRCIQQNGYVVLHDCNPPSEHHCRENFDFKTGPAGDAWNGTTWKAFYKARHLEGVYSCCVDSDWGIGILSKSKVLPALNNLFEVENPFFEFQLLEKGRVKHLNLVSFEKLAGGSQL
jgi:hypothetical protein